MGGRWGEGESRDGALMEVRVRVGEVWGEVWRLFSGGLEVQDFPVCVAGQSVPCAIKCNAIIIYIKKEDLTLLY